MSPELAAGLRRDFPSLYAWPSGPENAFVFECGSGWEPLIRGLSASLVLACPAMRCEQAKQKFGGLHYYSHPYTKETDAIIADAERQSFTICELCGADGTCAPVGSWMWTLCDSCREQRLKERMRG